MLLGEKLRWDHDRGLIAILDGKQCREERDDGFAAADVALQKPLHTMLAAHVREDFARRAGLRTGELERQHILQLRRELPLVLETSRPGIFCVGDVRSRSIKRVAAAVGEGSMAVRLVFERLESTGLALADSPGAD
jgi:hypothetical protein